MPFFSPQRDPGLHPYRAGLYFAFFNALTWQIATGTPTVLFMAYLGADAFHIGLVYSWTLLLTPVQVLATVLLPRLGFKRLTMMGWTGRTWFLVVPLTLTGLSRTGPRPWMIPVMVGSMFFFSLSRSVGASAITTWLQGLVPAAVRGRYWSTDQIMGGAASIGALAFCAAAFAALPGAWAFLLIYALSMTGGWVALRWLRTLPDIARPAVMSLAKIGADTPRHLFGPGPFRPYLWLAVLFFIVTTPLVPFGAYYLQTVAGCSPASIMGYTMLQYGGLIAGSWFMRSRIDRSGAKPFLRLAFILFGVVAAGWLGCLRWTPALPWVMPVNFLLLGAGTGMFTAANVSYLAKILPEEERALPVSLHGAMSYFLGGLAPVAWGLVLAGQAPATGLNLAAFRWFFGSIIVGAGGLVLLVNRLEEKAGHVDPLFSGGWLFRPFRAVLYLRDGGRGGDGGAAPEE